MVAPVIGVGVPDFDDQERPLFAGGGQQNSVGGRFSAIGLRATGETSVQAIYVLGASQRVFTISPDETYDPAASSGETVIVADVQPGRAAVDRVIRGTNTAARPNTNIRVDAGVSGVPLLFSDMILPTGWELWWQSTSVAQLLVVTFVWRELTRGPI